MNKVQKKYIYIYSIYVRSFSCFLFALSIFNLLYVFLEFQSKPFVEQFVKLFFICIFILFFYLLNKSMKQIKISDNIIEIKNIFNIKKKLSNNLIIGWATIGSSNLRIYYEDNKSIDIDITEQTKALLFSLIEDIAIKVKADFEKKISMEELTEIYQPFYDNVLKSILAYCLLFCTSLFSLLFLINFDGLLSLKIIYSVFSIIPMLSLLIIIPQSFKVSIIKISEKEIILSKNNNNTIINWQEINTIEKIKKMFSTYYRIRYRSKVYDLNAITIKHFGIHYILEKYTITSGSFEFDQGGDR